MLEGVNSLDNQVVKRKSPKVLIIALVTALVLVGGTASAFFLLNKSPKIEYLLAEVETIDLMGELFQERYLNELKWMETQQQKPTETTVELSAEWNDPYVGYEMEEIQSLVNSSTISLKNVFDPVKKETEIKLGGNLGSTAIDLGELFATPEKILLALPFTEDLIRFDDDDFGRMMRESDENYDGNENLGLSQLFETDFSSASELTTYIKNEYMEYLFNELPEESFTSEKEEVDVFGDKVKAKKLTMHLTEDEVKTLLKNLFVKLKDDDKLKEMLKDQMAMSSFAGDVTASDLTELISGYEEGLESAIGEVDSLHIPDGITSTIWHHSNHIIKRDFAMTAGEDKNDEGSVKVSGVQSLEKTNQKWEYTITATDSFDDEEVLKFEGDLSWKDNKAADSITITMDDSKVTYQGKEELKGKERTFSREFGYSDGYTAPKLIWSGSASHENDSMKARHEFTISETDIDENMYNLVIKEQGKIVKNVDMPIESDDTIILKDMEFDEIERYIENELQPKVQEWLMGLMGDLESELYN